jgi:hypothetical protein
VTSLPLLPISRTITRLICMMGVPSIIVMSNQIHMKLKMPHGCLL